MQDLAGAHALVTGGGTGIGLGIARRLLEAGAVTTLAGRREDVLEAAAKELGAAIPDAPEIRTIGCDVCDPEAVEAAVEHASDGEGRLQVAVANAGVGAGGPFLMLEADALRHVLDVNVVGAFNTLRAAALRMRDAGGSIIAISSIAGALGGRFRAAYATSKAGLDMLVRSGADELGGFGIRINSLRPGVVPSEATSPLFNFPDIVQDYERQMPLGFVGAPEDIGDAVVWLASPASRWVTGQNIAVDGGHTLRRAPDFERAIRAQLGEEAYAQVVKPGFGPAGT
ncbi:MAG: SDR family oxidoreductase [Myxococcota bacterium]